MGKTCSTWRLKILRDVPTTGRGRINATAMAKKSNKFNMALGEQMAFIRGNSRNSMTSLN
jgi:hypothetical protein